MKRSPHRRRAEMAAARRQVIDRSHGLCEADSRDCVMRGSQAHHIILRAQGGKDVLHNLLWVCSPCHDFIHDNPEISYERGWMKHAEVA